MPLELLIPPSPDFFRVWSGITAPLSLDNHSLRKRYDFYHHQCKCAIFYREVCLHLRPDGNNEVYGITPDGQYSARLTNNTFEEEWARFAPADFSKITFTSWRDGNPEIYRMNPDGTGQTRITNNPASTVCRISHGMDKDSLYLQSRR